MKFECGSCHIIPETRAEVSSTIRPLWYRIEKCGHQVCFSCAEKYKAHYKEIKSKFDAGGGFSRKGNSRRGISGGEGKCLQGFGTTILF